MSIQNISSFIDRWKAIGAAERANYALFLTELCEVLGAPRPEPTGPDDADNAYVFERNPTFRHVDGTTSFGRIDLYKRGCFVLEAKQGVEQKQTDVVRPLVQKRRRVAAETLCLRQTASRSLPPSASRRMRMISSVVCLFCLMVGSSLFGVGTSHSTRTNGRGLNHIH